jgi:zinc protease
MGMKDFSPVDLRKILAGRNAGVNLQLGADTDEIGGAAGSKLDDIEAMLQMLWLRFDGVRRDEGLFKSFMAKQEEACATATPARRRASATPWSTPCTANTPTSRAPPCWPTWRRSTSTAASRSTASASASARGFTFVVVGNVELEKIKPLLAAYLGTLPTPDLPLAYRDVGLRFASGVVKREVKAGTEPKSTVSLNFTGPATWSPDEQLRLEALVEVMNLRIVDVLREKMGVIYSGRMSGGIARVPYEHYLIGASLPTAPDQVERMTAALFAEIERIKKEGPDQADLDKVKRAWAQSWQRKPAEQRLLGGGAGRRGTVRHRPAPHPRPDAARGRAHAEDMKLAAQRYFNTENYVQVVLNPETPSRPSPALTLTASMTSSGRNAACSPLFS